MIGGGLALVHRLRKQVAETRLPSAEGTIDEDTISLVEAEQCEQAARNVSSQNVRAALHAANQDTCLTDGFATADEAKTRALIGNPSNLSTVTKKLVIRSRPFWTRSSF